MAADAATRTSARRRRVADQVPRAEAESRRAPLAESTNRSPATAGGPCRRLARRLRAPRSRASRGGLFDGGGPRFSEAVRSCPPRGLVHGGSSAAILLALPAVTGLQPSRVIAAAAPAVVPQSRPRRRPRDPVCGGVPGAGFAAHGLPLASPATANPTALAGSWTHISFISLN